MFQKNVLRAAALLACGLGAVSVPACGGELTATGDDGVLRGELAVYVADSLDGTSETSYYLRDAHGDEQRLYFTGEPALAPGTRVAVRGTPFADGIQVATVDAIGDTTSGAEVIRSSLIGGAPYAKRSFALVLIDLGGGVNTTAATAMGRLVGDADSIRNYYLYDSYQMQDIDAQVIGPIKYSLPTCSNTDTRNLATSLRMMVPGTFQHYLWYFGQRTSVCDWAGLGSVGTPQSPAKDTWYNGSSSCVVLVQEPGHNFGMQHSSSLRCGSAPLSDNPDSCTVNEYGDPFDPMGGGCRHMNAWQKSYQGWFGGCNGVKVSSSATFTLMPLEPSCNATQFLQIKAPKARMYNRPAGGGGNASLETFSHYYVELRTPQDFDGTLGNRTALSPMVLIHVGNDLRSRTQSGLHTFLLDMTPSTAGSSSGFNDAGLAAGQTFSDPAGGLSITATAVSATSATIQVTYTVEGSAPTCLDGSAFTPPGAVTCGTGAGGSTGAAGAGGSTGAAGMAGGRGGAGGTGGTAGGAGGTAGVGRGGAGGAAGGRGGATGGAGGGAAGANGGAGVAGSRAGAGGATGTAGATGMAGSAAGTNGSGGIAGAAGASEDGRGGTTGGAGDDATGTGVGGAVLTGAGGGVVQPPTLVAGCSCDVGGGAPRASGLFAIMLLALAGRRARTRRADR